MILWQVRKRLRAALRRPEPLRAWLRHVDPPPVGWRRLPLLRWTRRDRVAVMAASLALSALIATGATFAWFTVLDSLRNDFRAPQLDFHVPVVDAFAPPGGVRPGADMRKRVGAVNEGDLRAVVRVLVLPTIVAADGRTVLPARIGREVRMDIDEAHWADGRDGYYYYLGVLAPGQQTPDLITKVSLDADLPQGYDGAYVNVEVKSEASYARVRDYRRGWWGSAQPPQGGALAAIDAVLSPLSSY
jgi:hypothetical protein